MDAPGQNASGAPLLYNLIAALIRAKIGQKWRNLIPEESLNRVFITIVLLETLPKLMYTLFTLADCLKLDGLRGLELKLKQTVVKFHVSVLVVVRR